MKNRIWCLKVVRQIVLVEEELPEIKNDEVLVDVEACGICISDFYKYTGTIDYTSLTPLPYSLGHEAVGKVVKIGSDVKYCKVEDRVGIIDRPGFAEKIICKESEVAKVPVEGDPAVYISEPATCVIQFLKNFHFQPGQNVVIYGLGYMGLLILQCLPKYFSKVIVVEPREQIHNIAKEFGADICINPKKNNPLEIISDECPEGVDIIIDACGGIKSVFEESIQLLSKYGVVGIQWGIFSSLFKPVKIEIDMGLFADRGIRFVNSFSTDRLGDHRIAGQLLTKGVFDQRKLITHRFRFDEVPKAMELKYSMPANWIKGVIVNKE